MPDKIRGMYIMGENPAMSDPDVQHAREALAKLEHLVVQDIFLTETAYYADVILPASAFPEKDRHVHQHRSPGADRPPGARRRRARPGRTGGSSWSSAAASACDWNYAHAARGLRRDDDGRCRRSRTSPGSGSNARARSPTRAIGQDEPGHDVVFGDGFPTAERPRQARAGRRSLPPDEVPDAEYPMVLTTGRLLEHWHTGSMTRRSSVLDDARARGDRRHVARATCAGSASSAGDRIRVDDPPRLDRAEGPRRPATSRPAWSSSRSATPRPPPTC